MDWVIAGIIGLVIGGVFGILLARRGKNGTAELERLRAEANERVEAAKKEAEASVRAEVEALTAATQAEAEQRRKDLRKREDRAQKREADAEKRDVELQKRDAHIGRREKELSRREKRLDRQEADLDEALMAAKQQLEAVAGLSPEQAQAQILDEVRDEVRRQSLDEIRQIEREAKAVADERACMIVSAAIQRYASEHVADRTVLTVSLPGEDMKGRVIGREGRNIRAFESATGCDLIVDDVPDAVVISSFSPIRREIARISLERLLVDGRIHPARIEEVVAKVKSEIDQIIRKYGEDAALEAEVSGLSPEILKALGRLHFCVRFGQNVLRHSIEVAFLAGAMAAELDQNVKLARRAGLLHDIGKAAEAEADGAHPEAGAALLRKHGENKQVVQAVLAHHDPDLQKTMLSQLVAAANTLSGSRPGARRESLQAFVKRMEDLEAMVAQFPGVDQVYALQTGREVRVMVDQSRLSDRDAELLARDIAKRIETDYAHQGEVHVSVSRVTKAVQYAK